MSAIAELSEERIVEGVYAVARKQRLRTKGGAAYLALELVDPSGRIDARVWHDVELLDARFAEGDAVRVLGRVEKFRNRLQVDVRTLEAAPEADPAEFAPALRRDADELDGFLEFLAGEISHDGLAGIVTRFFSDDVLRASLLIAAALLHDVGRVAELTAGPTFRQTDEGRLLGHVHLGLRMIEERSSGVHPGARSELLHAIACHHDARAARTAEASVLYHANQLDAVAATRPIPD